MDKLTGIKIKYNDGTYSDQIPVGALAANVEWDSTHTLMDVIGTVDITNDGSLQDQITKRNNYIRFHADYSDPQTVTTNNPTGRRIASEQGAVAMGAGSISSGYAAFTGGNVGTVSSRGTTYSSEATGSGSIAWNGALASGTNSFAFGGTISNDQMQSDNTSPQYGRSVASGIGSVVLGGVANKATGTYAFAGGQNSSAEHAAAFVFGDRVKSGKIKQAVFGQNNVVDSGASLVVGVGADSSNRANAFTTGKDTDGNYITIGSTKITDTVPTSTLTGNIYLANAYTYGADGATPSKLTSQGFFGDFNHMFSAIPMLDYSTVGVSSSASISDFLQAWLKYIVAHYKGVIGEATYINNGQSSNTRSTMRPIVALINPSVVYLCAGAIYNPGAVSNDLPQYSGFTCYGVAGASQYIYTFGTYNYAFQIRRASTSTF